MEYPTKLKIDQKVTIVFSLPLIFSILLLAPQANAQLRPWDSANGVFVDFSVLNNSPRRYQNFSTPSVSKFRNQDGTQEPPNQNPISRLLIDRFPDNSLNRKTLSPRIRLKNPASFEKVKLKKPINSRKIVPIKKNKVLKKRLKKLAKKPQTNIPAKPKIIKKSTSFKTKTVAPANSAKLETPPLPPVVSPPSISNKNLGEVRPKKSDGLGKKNNPKPKALEVAKKTKVVSLQSKNNLQGGNRILFKPNSPDLGIKGIKILDSFKQKLDKNSKARMQLIAFADGKGMSPSKARRLSLSRALKVRGYLIEKGVKGTRIDVRALGNKVTGGPPDRVDIRVFE